MIVPWANFLYDASQKYTLSESLIQSAVSQCFLTHFKPQALRLHALSECLFMPGRYFLRSLASIVQPLAGCDKKSYCWSFAKRVAMLVQLLPLFGLAMITSPIAFLGRCVDHAYRPGMMLLETPTTAAKAASDLVMTEEAPLRVRTHNLGFVPTFMSTVGDLRDPMLRAAEVVQSVLIDALQPDIIFFQEAFHEDATRTLCEGIRTAYPYILHNVAPHISGFNSGAVVASKYPIKEIKFEPFSNMLGVENLSPRGILRITISGVHGEVMLYSVHTIALLGYERAESRYKQLKQIRTFMREDLANNPGISQILMGDFNTSQVTAWGESNQGQTEEKVLQRFNKYFHDFFLDDHHRVTGLRTSGSPEHLNSDNAHMGEECLEEPRGSWYHGPFSERGIMLNLKRKFECWYYGLEEFQPVPGVAVNATTWGTSEWYRNQTANTARFDYICVPKGMNDHIHGKVEIRRVIAPVGSQSASTDHLPVDGKLWLA
jgi:endonuclease/exonuclease/phosphatase family metal-dependent hydrolase